MIKIIIIYSNMKNKLISLHVIFTLLLIISGALYLIYIFRNRENFDSGRYSWKYGEGLSCKGDLNTNSELQNINSYFNGLDYEKYSTEKYNKTNIKNPNHHYASYCDIMSYNDLLAYKCLKISPKELSRIMDTNNIKNIFETIYIYNESSLYSYLLSKIQALNTINQKLQGPIYVCMSQSPYLKYSYNKTTQPISKWLDARIDILNNKNSYYSEIIGSSGIQNIITNTYEHGDEENDSISSLYAEILIIFPMYDRDMKLKNNEQNKVNDKVIIDKFLKEIISQYHTHNDMCFLKCNKSSTINCGCLNMNDSSSASTINTFTFNEKGTLNTATDFPRYTSKCIDHTSNNTSKEFSMMYFVNPYSDNYINIIHDPDGEAVDEDTGETIEGTPPPLIYDGILQKDTTPMLTADFYNKFNSSSGGATPFGPQQSPSMSM